MFSAKNCDYFHIRRIKHMFWVLKRTILLSTHNICFGWGKIILKTALMWRLDINRASDFFQDWWAEVTHWAKNGGSFSYMMDPRISTNQSWNLGYIILYLHTDTDTCMQICILTADYTVKPVLSGHSKKKTNYPLMQVKSIQNAQRGAFCNPFDLH